MIKLGINKRTAHGISYKRGYARTCKNWAVQRAISNENLARFGLISMADYYTKWCVTC